MWQPTHFKLFKRQPKPFVQRFEAKQSTWQMFYNHLDKVSKKLEIMYIFIV